MAASASAEGGTEEKERIFLFYLKFSNFLHPINQNLVKGLNYFTAETRIHQMSYPAKMSIFYRTECQGSINTLTGYIIMSWGLDVPVNYIYELCDLMSTMLTLRE